LHAPRNVERRQNTMNDDDDPFAAVVKRISDAVGYTQALALANQFILLEIVRDIALTTEAPDDYLASKYERVMARWEQAEDLDKPEHAVSVQWRETVARFFVKARHRLVE
jgi:hypothetical protein